MDDALATFIKKGTEIMTEWIQVNTELLLKDRCSSILAKALPILDCLTTFHTDIFGTPNWPSTQRNDLTLFLLKLYFSSIVIDVSEITNFFSLPINDILLTGAKFLLNTESDETASNKLDTLLISEINTSNELQHRFIFETLIQFDQILRMTTVTLWNYHKEKMKESQAANNIKAKMDAFRTSKATEATAEAIAKATASFSDTQTQNLQTKLRVSNLEKSFLKQEQKTNELLNIIKNNNNKKTQKNIKGSYKQELVTSPNKKAPQESTKRTISQTMVDLTSDDLEDKSPPSPAIKKTRIAKTKTQTRQQQESTTSQKSQGNPTPNPFQKQTISWKPSEMIFYNPNDPALKHTHTHPSLVTFSGQTYNNLSHFPSARIPTPTQTPFGQIPPQTTQHFLPLSQPFTSPIPSTGTKPNPFQLFPIQTPQITETSHLETYNQQHNKLKTKPQRKGQNGNRGRIWHKQQL